MVPVRTFVNFFIDFVYLFDNLIRQNIFPTFRTRMYNIYYLKVPLDTY
jgi:hypothetical protein